MRVNLSRLLYVTLFFLVPHLFWQGCSTTQQEDELAAENGYDQEGTEEGYADEEGYSEEGYEEEGYGEEGEEGYGEEGEEGYAEEGGEEEGYGYEEEGYGEEEGYAEAESSEEYENYEGYGTEEGEALVDNNLAGNQILDGEQTKSDLEDIIAGQNADMAEEIPANVANAEYSDPTVDPALAGTDAGMDTGMPVADAGVPATPGISAGPALPEMGAKMPYVVRVGETLSSIAQKVYGNSEKWQEMVEMTSLSNPDLVKPGDVVYYQLTEQTLAFATAYEGAPKEMLTVQPGDTLAGIAQRVYGAAGDWKFIWRHNGDLANPDKLEVGQSVYYVSPAGLSAAIDKLKSITIADLINQTFEKQAPNSNIQTVDQTDAPVQADFDLQQDQVNGFQIAKSMFNAFASNIGIAG